MEHINALGDYIQQQEDELVALRQDVEDLERDGSDLRNIIAECDEIKANLQQRNNYLTDQNKYLESRVIDLALDNAFLSTRNDDLKAGSVELHNTLSDLQRDINVIVKDLKDLDEDALRQGLALAIKKTEKQHKRIMELQEENRLIFQEPHVRKRKHPRI